MSLTGDSFSLSFPASYDIAKLRSLVPLVRDGKAIYLRSAIHSHVNDRVRHAIEEYLDEAVTDLRTKSRWQAKTEATRQQLGTFFNVPASSFCFRRDTTEGLNLFQRSIKYVSGDKVVLLDAEHPNPVYT